MISLFVCVIAKKSIRLASGEPGEARKMNPHLTKCSKLYLGTSFCKALPNEVLPNEVDQMKMAK